MNRDEVIAEKLHLIKTELESWAKDNGILKGNEIMRIEFTISQVIVHSKKLEICPSFNPDILTMRIDEFFSPERFSAATNAKELYRRRLENLQDEFVYYEKEQTKIQLKYVGDLAKVGGLGITGLWNYGKTTLAIFRQVFEFYGIALSN